MSKTRSYIYVLPSTFQILLKHPGTFLMLAAGVLCSISPAAVADSPELAMREFASGQIKKGVRSIGFGGDGATWGNYALVWKDAGTALADGGDTGFSNGNNFHFWAAGATTPLLWHDLAIYVIALKQDSNDIHFMTSSPAWGQRQPAIGQGSNQAIFTKMAMPLGNGLSAGVLLSHEVSQFSTQSTVNSARATQYQTDWRPSGGWGLAWEKPDSSLLVGFRALLNRDRERRIDATGTAEGSAQANEYRIGASYSPWEGALMDLGHTRLQRQNTLNGTNTTFEAPNMGFEQSFNGNRMALRFGLDESSPGAGFTARFAAFKLDVAYVHNMARERVGDLFGVNSQSLIMTLNFNYQAR